jgi:hypothetical protein
MSLLTELVAQFSGDAAIEMLLLRSFSRLGRGLVTEAEELAWMNGCARIETTSGDDRRMPMPFMKRSGTTKIAEDS